jgi:hypothetical protein
MTFCCFVHAPFVSCNAYQRQPYDASGTRATENICISLLSYFSHLMHHIFVNVVLEATFVAVFSACKFNVVYHVHRLYNIKRQEACNSELCRLEWKSAWPVSKSLSGITWRVWGISCKPNMVAGIWAEIQILDPQSTMQALHWNILLYSCLLTS